MNDMETETISKKKVRFFIIVCYAVANIFQGIE